MSKIVFVLGAGASAHCGTPLMDNFLEVAQDLLRSGEVDEVKEDFENVFNAVGYLREVHSKAILDLNNIEVIFTAFEMGRLLGGLPRIRGKANIDNLISSLRNVIGYTLEKTMKLKRRGDDDAPAAYSNFAGIINELINDNRDCSIITFNYDLGLDYSLYRKRIVLDYGLGSTELINKKYITLLKLHGSLNWYNCSKCKNIVPYIQFEFTQYTPGSNYAIIPVVSNLNKGRQCSSCKETFQKSPFIVPPTWNKTAFHGQINQVWGKAAHILKDAENIFVLGYSFPSTDWFFNYLFALGVDMTTQIRGFYVFNPDKTVENRFKDLLGPDVTGRFHYSEIPFEDSIKDIRTILDIKDTGPNIIHSSVPRGY